MNKWSGKFKNPWFGFTIVFNNYSRTYYVAEYRVRGERSNQTDYKNTSGIDYGTQEEAEIELKAHLGQLNIRKKVLNIPIEKWKEINNNYPNSDLIQISPFDLIKLIGCNGGEFLSAILNREEKIFVNIFYELYKLKQNIFK